MKKLLLVLVSVLAFSTLSFAADPVDLNTATPEQLETLAGVGPAKAKAIVDYRTEMGKFKTVDDLDNVKGFTKKGIDKLRDQATVGS
ncbi:MAG: helix-hairpin-helix domain-containing protein [Gammaproteobacteria bacterium]